MGYELTAVMGLEGDSPLLSLLSLPPSSSPSSPSLAATVTGCWGDVVVVAIGGVATGTEGTSFT